MTGTSTTVPRSLRLMQVAWVILVALNLAFFLLAIPARYSQLLHPPADVRASLAHLGVSVGVYAAYMTALNVLSSLVYFVVAGLIARSRFNDPMALVASFFLVELGGSSPATTTALAKAFPAFHTPVNVLTFLLQVAIVLFLYVFPNGRFVPAWVRNLFLLWLAGDALASVVTRASLYDNPPDWYGMALLIAFIVGAVSQVYRYLRVSDRLERQQTKWVVCGIVVALTVTFLSAFSVFPAIGRPASPYDAISDTIVTLGFLLVPITICIAVMRYRLWDIDVIINRTLVYGSLTVTLGAVYVSGVVGLQALFRFVTGQGSGLAVAISTLAIAALFQPLRRRLQSFIDRRFYRRKYDAAQTLAAFQLQLRDEVDLAQLSADLVAVVQDTMQPAHVSLWLRGAASHEDIGA